MMGFARYRVLAGVAGLLALPLTTAFQEAGEDASPAAETASPAVPSEYEDLSPNEREEIAQVSEFTYLVRWHVPSLEPYTARVFQKALLNKPIYQILMESKDDTTAKRVEVTRYLEERYEGLIPLYSHSLDMQYGIESKQIDLTEFYRGFFYFDDPVVSVLKFPFPLSEDYSLHVNLRQPYQSLMNGKDASLPTIDSSNSRVLQCEEEFACHRMHGESDHRINYPEMRWNFVEERGCPSPLEGEVCLVIDGLTGRHIYAPSYRLILRTDLYMEGGGWHTLREVLEILSPPDQLIGTWP